MHFALILNIYNFRNNAKETNQGKQKDDILSL